MSHIRKVIPLPIGNQDLIKLIRKVFGLNEYPYGDMDPDMILLAFVPKCNSTSDLISEFNKKYGTCDHQTLEFYGDRILYGVIANIIYDFFGLTMNPHFYTTLNSILTKNRLLTDIMLDKQACQLVRSPPYTIREGVKFHNLCADSFEALIGAIFIYLKTKRLDYMTHIKNWLLKNTGLPYVLKQYLNDVGFSDKTVYVVNDRDFLRNEWIKGYEELKVNLINNKDSVTIDTYQYLIDAYSKAQNVSSSDFSFTGIIVNPDLSINKIFEYLQWDYFGPVFVDNKYIVEASPGGIPTIIGSGLYSQEAITNAIIYLFSRGYIVPMKTISLHYSASTNLSASSNSISTSGRQNRSISPLKTTILPRQNNTISPSNQRNITTRTKGKINISNERMTKSNSNY